MNDSIIMFSICPQYFQKTSIKLLRKIYALNDVYVEQRIKSPSAEVELRQILELTMPIRRSVSEGWRASRSLGEGWWAKRDSNPHASEGASS